MLCDHKVAAVQTFVQHPLMTFHNIAHLPLLFIKFRIRKYEYTTKYSCQCGDTLASLIPPFAYNSVERDTDGLMSAGPSTVIGKEICFTRL